MNAQWKDSGLGDYISLFLVPVAGMMLLIPNYEDAELGRRGVLTFPLDLNFLRRHMCFSKLSLEQGRWWTTAAYMFVHRNRVHLESNVFALAPRGYYLTRNFGIFSCYFTFFGGGIFAAVESFGKDFQSERQLSSFLALPKSLGSISEWWDENIKKAAPILTKYTHTYMGCSAGVSAIDGMNIMVSIDQFFSVLLNPKDLQISAEMLVTMVPNILIILKFYRTEISRVRSGAWSGTDHARHVSGFCFGIGCYFLSKLASYWKEKMYRQKRKKF